jgi:hypothetical protein
LAEAFISGFIGPAKTKTAGKNRFIVIASDEFEKRRPRNEREISERTGDALKLIRLIAERTAVIGTFIFYPFIIWLIIFVSRIAYFDNWKVPLGLAVVLSLGALYAWASALLLRREAEKARSTIVGSLERLPVSAPIGRRLTRQLEETVGQIKSVQYGAFARLSQHPVLQVLLLPFGGVGGMVGIDLLSKLNF